MLKIAFWLMVLCIVLAILIGINLDKNYPVETPEVSTKEECFAWEPGSGQPEGEYFLALSSGLSVRDDDGRESFETQKHASYPIVDRAMDGPPLIGEWLVRICNGGDCGWVLAKYGCLMEK